MFIYLWCYANVAAFVFIEEKWDKLNHFLLKQQKYNNTLLPLPACKSHICVLMSISSKLDDQAH